MRKRKTTAQFIIEAKKVHGDTYLYSKTQYNKRNEDVIITCEKHGDFLQKPHNHLHGKGCFKCGRDAYKRRMNQSRGWEFEQPKDHKLIPLTKGKFALVDNEVYEEIKNINWVVTRCGYAKNDGLGLMHRFLLNADKEFDVDHINHDRLDNRKDNLRIVSRRENFINTRPRLGSSVYKGVHVNKSNGKSVARIKSFGKTIHLGTFNNEKDAAIAYDMKAVELFGEVAYLNFPEFSKGYHSLNHLNQKP